jgi:hypothetical protein
VLIQSMCEFGAFLLLTVYMFITLQYDHLSNIQLFALYVLIICACGIGPVLYLTMNAGVRERSVELLRWLKVWPKARDTPSSGDARASQESAPQDGVQA